MPCKDYGSPHLSIDQRLFEASVEPSSLKLLPFLMGLHHPPLKLKFKEDRNDCLLCPGLWLPELDFLTL